MPTPTIYLIAGCNGAGKTTFAKEFLPKEVKCDEIAHGLSPLKPSASAVQAALNFSNTSCDAKLLRLRLCP
jgi:predicted ABC-type ATPase